MTVIVCMCVNMCVFKVIHNITPYLSDAWEVKTGLTEWTNVVLMRFSTS